MKDVLKFIFGEISGKMEGQEHYKEDDDNSYIVPGDMRLADFYNLTNFDIEDAVMATIGGVAFRLFDRLPEPGDQITHEGFRFTVKQRSGLRISQLQVQRISSSSNQEALSQDNKSSISKKKKKKKKKKKNDAVVVSDNGSSSTSHGKNPQALPEIDKQQVVAVDVSADVTESELSASSLDDNLKTVTVDEKLAIPKKRKKIKKQDPIVVTRSGSSSKKHGKKPVTLPELDKQQLDTVDADSVVVSEKEPTASSLDDNLKTLTEDETLATPKKKKKPKKHDSIAATKSGSSSKGREKKSKALPEVASNKMPDDNQSAGEK